MVFVVSDQPATSSHATSSQSVPLQPLPTLQHFSISTPQGSADKGSAERRSVPPKTWNDVSPTRTATPSFSCPSSPAPHFGRESEGFGTAAMFEDLGDFGGGGKDHQRDTFAGGGGGGAGGSAVGGSGTLQARRLCGGGAAPCLGPNDLGPLFGIGPQMEYVVSGKS